MYKDIAHIKKNVSDEVTYIRRNTLTDRQIVEFAIVMASDEESYRYEEHLDWVREEFRTLDHATRGYVFAEQYGRIIGFARVWMSPHINRWMLEGYEVTPDYRRKGIGSRLVIEAMKLAEQMGATEIYSHQWKDNDPSLRAHKKAGFEIISDSFLNSFGNEREGTHWELRKSISNGLLVKI